MLPTSKVILTLVVRSPNTKDNIAFVNAFREWFDDNYGGTQQALGGSGAGHEMRLYTFDPTAQSPHDAAAADRASGIPDDYNEQ